MGMPMTRRLLKVGYKPRVYDLFKEPVETISKEGAIKTASARELSETSDVILLSLPDGEGVTQALFGENGALEGARKGSVIIDTITVGPSYARRIATKLQEKGVKMLDAPVSGGPEGATNGTLSIMVGGERQVFEDCLEILRVLGEHIFYMGDVGSGQSTKLVNQILVGVNVVGACEALMFASAQGLDLEKVADVIKASAGDSWMFRRAAPQIISDVFLSGFATFLVHKDLGLALGETAKIRGPMTLCSVARELLGANLRIGNDRIDVASVVKVLENISGLAVRHKKAVIEK
jgi:3-hydroxyisobutyrate dehydrogenase-like beta-hydroxyacid dehydrogenase